MKRLLIRWIIYTCTIFLCYFILYYIKHESFDFNSNMITLIISSVIFLGVSIYDIKNRN
jgi:hypothetical protein